MSVRHHTRVVSNRGGSVRRRGWAAAFVAAATAAGLVTLLVILYDDGRDASEAGAVAGVLSLLLAYVVAVISLIRWMVRRVRTAPTEAAQESLVRLRRVVRRQWSAEAAARQLPCLVPGRLFVGRRPVTRREAHDRYSADATRGEVAWPERAGVLNWRIEDVPPLRQGRLPKARRAPGKASFPR